MFEALSGSSQSKNSRRPIAVLTALGLHAAVIGGFILASMTTQTIVEPQPPRIRPPIFANPPHVPEGRGGKPAKPPPSSGNTSKRRPSHMQQPREMMAAQIPDPIAPDPIAGPSSNADANPSNILPSTGDVSGDGGEPGNEGKGSACPPGATCTNAGDEQILAFSNAMARPHARCNPPSPSAPYAARQIGLDGRVVAQFVIHADGRADSVSVLNNDAPPMLAQSVREWIEQCGFEPAQLNGAPYAVRMTQVFRFTAK